MRGKLSLVVVALAVAFLAGRSVAFAQDGLIADIPFSFMAAGHQHPAGQYLLSVQDNENSLMLTPESKGVSNVILAHTRLAAPAARETDGRLVFDKVGEIYYLSEAWFPDQDGYVLNVTKEAHTHHVIRMFHRKAK